MTTTITAKFSQSCNEADKFPQNLIVKDTFDYSLEAYFKRLNECQDDLFSLDEKAFLEFWDYVDEEQEFQEKCTYSLEKLQDYLCQASKPGCRDPRCRFIFVLAPQSRAPLHTSRKMLTYTFTYHQVMPSFLDFLFPFGQQIYTQDFSFSGFRHKNCLADADAGPNLPRLGRSGREIHMCYSLKSVEKSEVPQHSWSIRQTATYHSFDIESGNALWISVKGNDLIKDRVMSATEDIKPDERPFSTIESAFAQSLAIHSMNCKWAGEEWRWYLNVLEENIQGETRHALSERVVERRPEGNKTIQFLKDRTRTASGRDANRNGGTNPSDFLQPPQGRPNRSRSISRGSAIEPGVEDRFSFDDMRHLQSLEEKVNEVIFVLIANIDVLRELKDNYHSLITSEGTPKVFVSMHKMAIERFEKQVTSIIRDLQIQVSRAKTLIRLLADRRALLYGVLEYLNMKANKSLAKKAQNSADNMEKMTEDMQELTKQMHQLAKKSTKEAVSMKIITLVTLFFLPGTFISVGSHLVSFLKERRRQRSYYCQILNAYQTIMSTDIIKFESADGGPGPKVFQMDALALYLYISLPLMVVTFAVWGILIRLESLKAMKQKKRNDEVDEEKGQAKTMY